MNQSVRNFIVLFTIVVSIAVFTLGVCRTGFSIMILI